jgi:predicted RNase H-like HicB family nuclease
MATNEKMMRQVVLYPGEDGYWVVECPSLPGCISQGETFDAAISNIKEAIEVWIEDALEHGEPVPEDTRETQLLLV